MNSLDPALARACRDAVPPANTRLRAAPDRLGLVALMDLLRRGDLTRREIEERTGLGRSAAAERIQALQCLGLVSAGEARPSQGGRSPGTVGLRADAGCALVARVEPSRLDVGLADLKGRLVFEHHEDLAARDPESVLGRLFALFDWARDQQDRPVWGIGIGVPSAVETRPQGSPAQDRLAVGPGWVQAQALERILARYRAPVMVRSAVQMAALGEVRRLGAAWGSDAIYVDLGREVTAALVANGQLVRGALGVAGQLGHVASGRSEGRRCRCGSLDCLETVAGSEALAASAKSAAANGGSPLLARALSQGELEPARLGDAAQGGDAAAAEILATAGEAVGAALATLTNALNPAAIVLAGDVAETGEILLAAVRETLYRRAHPLVTRDLRILRSRMSRSAPLAGAACAVVDDLFRPDRLAGWIASGTPLGHADVAARLSALDQAATGQSEDPGSAAPRADAAP